MDESPTRSPARTKIAVKDILRSSSTDYTTFPPTSRYAQQRAPRKVPFSLTDLNNESSSKHRAASFGNLLSGFRYNPESPSRDESSSSEPPMPVRELRERKAKPKSFPTLSDYMGEENLDEPFERWGGRKRKRVTLDSDDEGDYDDDDDDDEDGGAYIDEEERSDRVHDQLSTSAEGVGILRRLFPKMSQERIEEALEQAGGSQVVASKILAGNRLGVAAPVTPPRKLQRLRQRKMVSLDEEDESGSEGEESIVDHRARLEEARKLMQVLRFYNKATMQEIQDINGCSVAAAEKFIKLRPFKDIDELRETLQQERGLSPKFISNYVDMQDGYNLVDQIIENIEELGNELKQIIDIWKGEDPKSNNVDSPNQSETSVLEGDGGMHLAGTDVNAKSIDKTSKVYKDAMDGFLTEQPAIVNKEITLKSYQIIGVNWLLMLYRKGISGILADEMGLGKTAQVISFLGRLYELGNKGPHLIIVPTSTLDNWLREFERFCPALKVHGYYGTQDERLEMREELMKNIKDYNVIITTYNIATGAKDDRSFLRKLKCKSMILDEGHMVRNCTSARYRHLIALKTPFRLLLTGTPLQNNLQELVSLLMFIMPDMLLENEEEIRKIFKIKAVTTNVGTAADKRMSSAQLLSRQRIARAKKMMTPFVLRRRKADVLKDLPKKIQVIERCPMTKNQQKLYDSILSESRQSYKEALNSKSQAAKKEGTDRFKNIVIQLRKAADHPLLFRHIYDDKTLKKMAKAIKKEEQYWDSVEEYIYEDMTVMSDFELDKLCREHKTIKRFALKKQEWMDAGKVEKLKEILATWRKKGSKILLFSQFTRLLDILELVMDTLGYRYLRLDGETKMADRQVLIDKFNEDDTIDVFLLSTKAGGFGINLTAANVVILYDLDFNPQNDRQAEDRAHRVGQTQDVTIIKLIADKSIEEHILSMAEIKLRLDRSVSGLQEGQEDNKDEEEEKENVHSLLKTVLLS